MSKKNWHFHNAGMDRDEVQHDYIEFGSPEHAVLLGIRKVGVGEKPPFAVDGYCFIDPSPYLQPFTRPEFVQGVLQGKVNELKSKPEVPANATRLWEP